MKRRARVFLTGATGTLGSLLVDAFLQRGDAVIAPVRRESQATLLTDRAAAIARDDGQLQTPLWPTTINAGSLSALLRVAAPTHLVHAAGCLSYFDTEALSHGNEGLTGALLGAASTVGLEKFVYVSTAFSQGIQRGLIRETLPARPVSGWHDPTPYTASKRRCEQLVATSELPWLIIRPSVVIGDSRDGHYSGRRYGLYQLWTGVERYLLRERHQEVHCIAGRAPMPLVHQDAFVNGLLAATEQLGAGSVCHLTSNGPSVREITELALRQLIRPERVHCYDSLDEVPMERVPTAQRSFMTLAATNLRIASHQWKFETTTLASLTRRGLQFPDVTLQSVERCQASFVKASPRLRRYLQRHAA